MGKTREWSKKATVAAFLRLRSEQAMADEWWAAFEHALQKPRGKPARRWWSRVS